jgi:hypothetical protein
MRDPADVGVRAAHVIEDPDLQLVVDVLDAVCIAGIADRRAALAEAADRHSQHDFAIDCRDRDLIGREDPCVTLQPLLGCRPRSLRCTP